MMDDVHADQDWIDGNQDQDRTGNDVLKASLVVCKIQESRIKMGHLAGRRRWSGTDALASRKTPQGINYPSSATPCLVFRKSLSHCTSFEQTNPTPHPPRFARDAFVRSEFQLSAPSLRLTCSTETMSDSSRKHEQPRQAKAPRARLSEGYLLPSSFRWKDIRAWYDYHFGMRSPWDQVKW